MQRQPLWKLWLTVGALGCAPASPTAPALRIGAVLDRTGPRATSSWSQAAHLAAAHANEGLLRAGQGDALRFEIALSDSVSDPSVAVRRARELVAGQGVKALITDSSEDDIAIHMLAYDGEPRNDLGVPIVCMACTSPHINNPAAQSADPVRQAALRNPLRWNFRTIMNSTPQAQVISQIVSRGGARGDRNGDGRLKLTVFAANDSFGVGFSGSLKDAAERLGLSPQVALEQLFFDVKLDPDSHDWGADIARLTDSSNHSQPAAPVMDGAPDVIIEAAAPQFAAALMRSYLSGGGSIPFVHTHNFRTAAVLRQLGAALNGQEGTSPVLFERDGSGELFARELEALQRGVAPAFEDAHAYDAATALMLAALVALQRSGGAGVSAVAALSGAQLRDALAETSAPAGEIIRTGPAEFARAAALIRAGQAINYQGASGPMDFDAAGNVRSRVAHWRVEDARFVDAEIFDCVADLSCPLRHD